jgi:hypothetical protein
MHFSLATPAGALARQPNPTQPKLPKPVVEQVLPKDTPGAVKRLPGNPNAAKTAQAVLLAAAFAAPAEVTDAQGGGGGGRGGGGRGAGKSGSSGKSSSSKTGKTGKSKTRTGHRKGIDLPEISSGALIGGAAGAVLGGIGAGGFLAYRAHKRGERQNACALAIGTGAGAVAGGLIGAAAGAFTGKMVDVANGKGAVRTLIEPALAQIPTAVHQASEVASSAAATAWSAVQSHPVASAAALATASAAAYYTYKQNKQGDESTLLPA